MYTASNCLGSGSLMSIRQVNSSTRGPFEIPGPCKHRLDRLHAGLEDSRSYRPVEMRDYCFRWNKFGKSTIPVDLSHHNSDQLQVEKGCLVSYTEGPNNLQPSWFHFTRLPSPLTGKKPHYWAVDIAVSRIFAWDICPLSSGLLAVATKAEDDRCVCLQVLTIKSSLTVGTRYFQVKLFKMKDGLRYDTTYNMTFSILAGDGLFYLQLTSRRLAVVVQQERGVKVHAWDSEDGEPCIVSRSISLPKTSLSHGSVEGEHFGVDC